MSDQNRQSHRKKEIEETSLVTHSDPEISNNHLDKIRQEELQHHNEKIRDLKNSILKNGDASTSESQGTRHEHVYQKMCFDNKEMSKEMSNSKFPTDAKVSYMHLPNTYMDSKSSDSHRYNKNRVENSPSTSCQGVNTEEQRIHQNTSFQDDQYDDNLLYANEDTNHDETVLNNAGSASEKGLFCEICRGMISVCQREPDNGLSNEMNFPNQNNFQNRCSKYVIFFKIWLYKNQRTNCFKLFIAVLCFFPVAPETYLGPCQISAMERFCQKLYILQ